MPTLDQLEDWVKTKKRKYGGSAHCNQPVVSEEVRKEAVVNAPDATGRQKTRIGLETYSPSAYSAWNAQIESLMEQCGFNPILVVDVMLCILRLAGEEGVQIAKEGLFKVMDYDKELRDAKAEKRRLKKAGNAT